VKFLTDTNAFLWFITDSPRLPVNAKALLEARDNERLLSIASVWEIAIKASLGKLTFRNYMQCFSRKKDAGSNQSPFLRSRGKCER
jgi:PIN domain nuclease of toxin-antitoxin system